jgi:hypothetical protein
MNGAKMERERDKKGFFLTKLCACENYGKVVQMVVSTEGILNLADTNFLVKSCVLLQKKK